MSAEPKQAIGDQLRTFAKQRRDAAGPPFQPHGVTRKLLQDEVARTFSARTIARQTTPPRWLAAFWPRLIFAGGLVAFFITAVVFWLPKDSHPGTQLAKTDDRVAPEQEPASTPDTLPALKSGLGGDETAPSDLLASKQTKNEAEGVQRYGLVPQTPPEANSFFVKPEAASAQAARSPENQRADPGSLAKLTLQQNGNGAAASPLALPLTAAPAQESKSNTTSVQGRAELPLDSANQVSKLEETLARSTPNERDEAVSDQLRKAKQVALASASAGRTETQSGLIANVSATNVFFFSQADVRDKYRRNFNSPPVPPVLRSFQVQQSGASIRILDDDGSVYEGIAEQPVSTPLAQFGEVASSDQRNVTQRISQRPAGSVERTMQQQRVRPAGPASADSAMNVTFRATGTNQSIKQLVVVTGQLQSDNHPTAESKKRGLNNVNSLSQAVMLRAKASIGRNVEIPIEASGTTR